MGEYAHPTCLAVNVSYPTLTGLQSITGPLPSKVHATLADGTYLLANLSFDGSFTGGATVTFHYDPNRLSPDVTASQLEILHFNGTTWDNLGGTVDPVADTISFTTPSLSPFVLVATPEPASLSLLALGGMALTHRNRRRKA